MKSSFAQNNHHHHWGWRRWWWRWWEVVAVSKFNFPVLFLSPFSLSLIIDTHARAHTHAHKRIATWKMMMKLSSKCRCDTQSLLSLERQKSSGGRRCVSPLDNRSERPVAAAGILCHGNDNNAHRGNARLYMCLLYIPPGLCCPYWPMPSLMILSLSLFPVPPPPPPPPPPLPHYVYLWRMMLIKLW